MNVVHIKVPPLRDWSEDIPLLCQHFINIFNEKFSKDTKGISPAAMKLLQQHTWPGNVRELENVLERAVVLAEEPVLTIDHFPPDLGARADADTLDAMFDGFSLKTAQKSLEKQLIVRALTATKGNRTQASKLLEISHPSLLTKIKAYNIDL